MKILHLFANWKWTGPAEPALATAAVQAREHDVLFVSGRSRTGEPSFIEPEAQARGVPTRGGFHLGKHARFRPNREDARALAELLAEWRPDIVHSHLDNDHRIASLAMKATGIGRLVRTAHETAGLSGAWRTRRLARRRLDGLVCTTRHGLQQTLRTYGGSEHTVSVAGKARPVVFIESGVDLDRFDPQGYDRGTERARLGFDDDDVVVGIVARVQPHRRFDLLLDAHEQALLECPRLKLLVLGRGTRLQTLLLDPVAERGLGESILSAGYVAGEGYPATLAALDAALFLVPGTDGACRALREEMAMGLPPLVLARDPLPDLVEEGNAGVVVEESVTGLRDGLVRLASEPALRERLGRGAHEVARRRFDMRTQAHKVTTFYETILDRPASPP